MAHEDTGDSKSSGFVTEFNRPRGAVNYRNMNVYEFLNDAFDGTGVFNGSAEKDSQSVIIHSRSEPEAKYWERVERSFFPNMVEPFVTAQYDPVFSEQPPITEVLDSNGNAFEVDTDYFKWQDTNVDGAGSNKNQVNANACQSAYLKRVTYLVMDMAENMTEPVVYMQEAETVDRSQILVDNFGRLTQIAFIVIDSYDKDHKPIYRRTTWTNEDVRIETSKDQEKWKQISLKPLKISKMPIHPVFSQQRTKTSEYLPFPSSTYKVASANVTLYNSYSEYVWHLVNQALARIVTDADGIESIGDAYSNATKLSTINGDKGATMSYINADTGIAPNHKDLISTVTSWIVNVMAQQGVVVELSESGSPESGRAKSLTYSGKQAKLNFTVTKMCVPTDEWMQETWKEYRDPSGDWTATTTYKTDYGVVDPVTVADLREIIVLLQDVKLLEPMKAAVKEIIGKLTNDKKTLQLLSDEVDEMQLPDTRVNE